MTGFWIGLVVGLLIGALAPVGIAKLRDLIVRA
jgi:hypothetical protein